MGVRFKYDTNDTLCPGDARGRQAGPQTSGRRAPGAMPIGPRADVTARHGLLVSVVVQCQRDTQPGADRLIAVRGVPLL